jgi:hypothetical protein
VTDYHRGAIRFYSVSKADLNFNSDTFAVLLLYSMRIEDQNAKIYNRLKSR